MIGFLAALVETILRAVLEGAVIITVFYVCGYELVKEATPMILAIGILTGATVTITSYLAGEWYTRRCWLRSTDKQKIDALTRRLR